jgi:hypothetical protein
LSQSSLPFVACEVIYEVSEARSQKTDEKADRTYLVFPWKPFQDGSLFTASTKCRHGAEEFQCSDDELIMGDGQIGVQINEVIRR